MVAERNKAFYLYNNHFCLIWKSEDVSFNRAIKELKEIFKVVDNFITEENVNSLSKYEFLPKKKESHLTIFILYDLEIHNTDRAGPYCISFYLLSKLAGRFNHDSSRYDLEKSKTDTFVIDGDDCISKALNFLLKLKGE